MNVVARDFRRLPCLRQEKCSGKRSVATFNTINSQLLVPFLVWGFGKTEERASGPDVEEDLLVHAQTFTNLTDEKRRRIRRGREEGPFVGLGRIFPWVYCFIWVFFSCIYDIMFMSLVWDPGALGPWEIRILFFYSS